MIRWNQVARAAGGGALVAVALLLGWSGGVAAQGLTPEGTKIVNKATATYTDANSNAYASVTDSVVVTVGFKAGLDVVSPSVVNPSAGTTDQTITYTVINTGNGAEPVTIAGVETDPKNIISNITYCIGTTCTSNPADLTAVIGNLPAGDSVKIVVHYDVAAGGGGESATIALTGSTSHDGSTASDTSTTTVTPTMTGSVAVTPDSGAVNQLPSNGVSYSATFTVQNNQTGTANYTLVAAVTGANSASLAISAIQDCTSHAVISSISLATGASKDVCVIYTVGNVAAGSTGTLTLTASAGSITDNGRWFITVVRPSLSISKKAYLDNAGALGNEITNELPKPGDFIWYKITVKNTGLANATSVSISDPLPTQVTHISHAGDSGTPAWDFSASDATPGTIRATLSSMAPDAERYILIRVQVK